MFIYKLLAAGNPDIARQFMSIAFINHLVSRTNSFVWERWSLKCFVYTNSSHRLARAGLGSITKMNSD